MISQTWDCFRNHIGIIGKKRPVNKAEIKVNVIDFMEKRRKDKRQVKKYFHAKHVGYAA